MSLSYKLDVAYSNIIVHTVLHAVYLKNFNMRGGKYVVVWYNWH